MALTLVRQSDLLNEPRVRTSSITIDNSVTHVILTSCACFFQARIHEALGSKRTIQPLSLSANPDGIPLMSVYITLGTPGTLNFDAFSESTRSLLALLSPLVGLRRSNAKIGRDISVQVAGFMGAIRRGVKASQLGFTTAEDLIALSSMVQSSTRTERAEYLMGTLKLANEAYNEGKEAYQAFTDVRRKIFALIDQLTATIQNADNSPILGNKIQAAEMRRSLDAFRQAVDVLEKFGQHTSALAQWWDWIQVETNARPSGQKSVVFDESSLSDPVVIERWRCLRTQFADYTNMVAQLEDTYPELFSMPVEPVTSNQGLQTRNTVGIFRPDLQRAVSIDRKHAPIRLSDTDGEDSAHNSRCCIIA